MPDEANGLDKIQNMDCKHLIDGSIKRLSQRCFETDVHKRCLTYYNKQVITRLQHGKVREDVQCAQYLFNLFHEDIPYVLGALRGVKILTEETPSSHTSFRKAAPASVVGQSFTVDQSAISHRNLTIE